MGNPEDTLLRSYSAEYDHGGISFKVDGHHATRRYDSEQRIAIVHSSIDKPIRIGNEDVSGIEIREKSWTVFSRPTQEKSSASDLTLMQMCWETTVDVGQDVPDRNRHNKMLTDLHSRLRKEFATCSQQQIEDYLLTRSHPSCTSI